MSQEILSSLTAERLDELAAYMDGPLVRIPRDYWPQIAAALRALAKAERAMRADDTLSVQHGDVGEPPMPGFIAARDDIRIPRFGPLHPTLLAALGSVGQQEKHDAEGA